MQYAEPTASFRHERIHAPWPSDAVFNSSLQLAAQSVETPQGTVSLGQPVLQRHGVSWTAFLASSHNRGRARQTDAHRVKACGVAGVRSRRRRKNGAGYENEATYRA